MLNRIIRPLVRLSQRQRYVLAAPSVRGYAAAYSEGPPPVTMDDLPVPCGSWETHNKTIQAKYRMQMAAGMVTLVISLIVLVATGNMDLYYELPEYPPKNK